MEQCQVQRGLTRGKLFGGWIISPFTSHSSVSNVLNGSRGIETTSACLVTNIVSLERESWADWLRSTGSASYFTILLSLLSSSQVFWYIVFLREQFFNSESCPSTNCRSSRAVWAYNWNREQPYFFATFATLNSCLCHSKMLKDTLFSHHSARVPQRHMCAHRMTMFFLKRALGEELQFKLENHGQHSNSVTSWTSMLFWTLLVKYNYKMWALQDAERQNTVQGPSSRYIFLSPWSRNHDFLPHHYLLALSLLGQMAFRSGLHICKLLVRTWRW